MYVSLIIKKCNVKWDAAQGHANKVKERKKERKNTKSSRNRTCWLFSCTFVNYVYRLSHKFLPDFFLCEFGRRNAVRKLSEFVLDDEFCFTETTYDRSIDRTIDVKKTLILK